MNQNQKFALGGGGYVLYAPDYPRYQTSPGYSDPVHLYNTEVSPMYHVSFLDAGVPLHMTCKDLKFVGGAAVLTYTDGKSLTATERRLVTTDDRCVSNIKIEVSGKEEREISIVLWTTTDVQGEAPSLEGDSFRVRRTLDAPDGTGIPVEIIWSSPSSKGAHCLQAFHCEGGSDRPDYEETPWFDMGPEFPTPRAKRPMVKPSPISPEARCYLGLFRTEKLKGGAKAEHRFEANVVFKGSGINYRPRRPDPKDENNHQAFLSKAPKFQCESKEIERVVNHRFEMLHLLRMPSGVGNMSSPSVCVGSGRLHQVTANHAPALVREARWLSDPIYARGLLKVFFENIRQSGLVPGWISLTKLTNTDFFHADWGGAFEALDAMHPDRATKRAVLMGMQRYVRWLANNRDPEGSGLTDVVNHFESGQSFTRRFTVISEKSDNAEEHVEEFRVKAVDASIFRYRMVRFLHKVADEMQEKSMANRFAAEAEDIKEIIGKRMWDEKSGLYMDIDPKTRHRTGVKAAVGFYPMATDIPKPANVERMLSALADRKEFWTKHPVPTIAMSDPYYNTDAHWKGTRIENPANGRTNLAANCHIMDGLTYRSERGDKKARRMLGELFRRTMTMVSGELENTDVASSFEHYHPVSGRASRYLGTGNFFAAAMLDNIFRVACGFAVRFNEVQMDPVIDDMPDFKLHGVPVGNKRFNVERKGKRVKIVPGVVMTSVVSFADVEAAAERIAGHVHRTPVLTSATLDRELGASVFFKCENMQKVGAFKARGATNAVFSLTEEECTRGVITHSSGNHGAAVAYAAAKRGAPCTVVMPEKGSPIKVAAVIGYGAKVERCAEGQRQAAADAIIASTGATFIHPFNDPRVIAGQGTAALELLEDVPDLDAVIAPVGGGGLLSGTTLTFAAKRPEAKIFGAEPTAVDDAFRSLRDGVRHPSVPNPNTICDGLLTGLGENTYAILNSHGVEIVCVNDDAVIVACRFHLERMKMLVEPSGATPLAALRTLGDRIHNLRIGAIITGGNTDLTWL